MSGISLWLSPYPPHPLVDYLAQLSSENNTPLFRPHLTLLSDHLVPSGLTEEQILSTVTSGVKKWVSRTPAIANGSSPSHSTPPPLEIEFKDVRKGPLYYQCVLAACEELEPLTSLHEAMKTEFKVTTSPKYFPHLSLVYGDLSDETKDRIIKTMQDKGELVDNDQPGKVKVAGCHKFRPKEILIMDTKGLPDTWKVIGKVTLPEEVQGAGNGGEEEQGIFGWAINFLSDCVIS